MSEELLHNPEDENEIEIISLKDDEGNDRDFEILDELDYNNIHYCALLPYYEKVEELDNKSEEDTDIMIIRLTKDENGDEFCETIDDDNEFDAVAALFDERIDEMYKDDPEPDQEA